MNNRHDAFDVKIRFETIDHYLENGLRDLILNVLTNISNDVHNAGPLNELNIVVTEHEFQNAYRCRTLEHLEEHFIQIIFIEKNHTNLSKITLSCPNGKIFFRKNTGLKEFTATLEKVLTLTTRSKLKQYSYDTCKYCQCSINLSSVQEKILLKITSGVGFHVISKDLNINYKTLLRYKDQMIARFNLKGNRDLTAFAREMVKVNNNRYDNRVLAAAEVMHLSQTSRN